MFGLRTPELIVILVVIVLLFGPSKLAGVGAGLGKSIRDFQKALHEERPAIPPAAPPEKPDGGATSDSSKPSSEG